MLRSNPMKNDFVPEVEEPYVPPKEQMAFDDIPILARLEELGYAPPPAELVSYILTMSDRVMAVTRENVQLSYDIASEISRRKVAEESLANAKGLVVARDMVIHELEAELHKCSEAVQEHGE